jgi:hypothetical protein
MNQHHRIQNRSSDGQEGTTINQLFRSRSSSWAILMGSKWKRRSYVYLP